MTFPQTYNFQISYFHSHTLPPHHPAHRQEAIKDSAKKHGTPIPGWVKALDAPGNAAERLSEGLDDWLEDLMYKLKKPFRKGPKTIDRPLSMLQMQEEMAQRLSTRDMSGHIPDDVLNNPEVRCVV